MFGRPFGRPDRPRTALLPCLFRRPRGCCRRGRHVRLRRPMGTCRAKLPDPPRLVMWVLLGGRLGRARLRTRLEGHHHVHDPAGLPRGRDRVPPLQALRRLRRRQALPCGPRQDRLGAQGPRPQGRQRRGRRRRLRRAGPRGRRVRAGGVPGGRRPAPQHRHGRGEARPGRRVRRRLHHGQEGEEGARALPRGRQERRQGRRGDRGRRGRHAAVAAAGAEGGRRP